MRLPIRITLGVLGFILLAASYFSVRHYRREGIPAGPSIHPEPTIGDARDVSTAPTVDPMPQDSKSHLATVPFAGPAQNPGGLSHVSAEGKTVRVALQQIEEGDLQKARDSLLATISAAHRGANYLRYGRPDRTSMRKELSYTGKEQVWIENWVYEKGGRVLREVEFAVKPEDEQTVDPDPAHPDAGASALWAYAYTFYKEGGLENLQKAKSTFQDFLALYPNGPVDLVQAAQIDVPVIDIELMRSAPTLGYRIAAAREAAQGLMHFLSRWPDYPGGNDLKIALKIVQDFLANPR